MNRNLPTVATACLLAGVCAPPALADPFSLQLSGSSSATAGQPYVAQVIGKNPTPQEYGFLTWLWVDLFPAKAVPACPAYASAADQLAPGTGGANLAVSLREDIDANGNWTAPVGFTPGGASPLLLCAYTENEVGGTLATASLTVTVAPAAPAPASTPTLAPTPPPAAAPAGVERPSITRSGSRLTCGSGGWRNGPASYAYGWLVDGTVKRGATGQRLKVTRALRGHRVRCRVTASNAGGSASAVSRAVRIR
jgi:hypothetical protein